MGRKKAINHCNYEDTKEICCKYPPDVKGALTRLQLLMDKMECEASCMLTEFNSILAESRDETRCARDIVVEEHINSSTPQVKCADGRKVYIYRFDLKEFKRHEIHVDVADRDILIRARHQEASGNRTYLKEFSQVLQLPEDLTSDDVKSELDNDLMLKVEVTFPKEDDD